MYVCMYVCMCVFKGHVCWTPKFENACVRVFTVRTHTHEHRKHRSWNCARDEADYWIHKASGSDNAAVNITWPKWRRCPEIQQINQLPWIPCSPLPLLSLYLSLLPSLPHSLSLCKCLIRFCWELCCWLMKNNFYFFGFKGDHNWPKYVSRPMWCTHFDSRLLDFSDPAQQSEPHTTNPLFFSRPIREICSQQRISRQTKRNTSANAQGKYSEASKKKDPVIRWRRCSCARVCACVPWLFTGSIWRVHISFFSCRPFNFLLTSFVTGKVQKRQGRRRGWGKERRA